MLSSWALFIVQILNEGCYLYFYFYSGNDYTNTFGSNAFDGNLVPFIDNCFQDVNTCILDGEMVGYNPKTGVIGKWSLDFLYAQFLYME